jgi:hypothetical protein
MVMAWAWWPIIPAMKAESGLLGRDCPTTGETATARRAGSARNVFIPAGKIQWSTED